MERFTNNTSEYFDQIVFELSSFDIAKDWKPALIYVEVGQILLHAYSIGLGRHPMNPTLRGFLKIWESETDRLRFQHGIYNLDRIAVSQKLIHLSDSQILELSHIEFSQIDLVEFQGIVLDGLHCKLIIPNISKTLLWNIDQEMNEELSKLIRMLRDVYKFYHDERSDT